MPQSNEVTSRKALRLWPGVVLAIVLVLAQYVVRPIVAGAEVSEIPLALIAVFTGMLCAVGIIVWWMFFSRAPWFERLAALTLMIVAVAATRLVVHESIQGGMMGMMLPVMSFPVVSVALVIWAVATRHVANGPRRVALVAAILLACGVFTLLRTDGVTGDGAPQLAWRWTPTPEERRLAQSRNAGSPAPPAPAAPAAPRGEAVAAKAVDKGAARAADVKGPKPDAVPPAMSERVSTRVEWPGFRGPARDAIVRDARIETDWSRTPPIQLWRRPIGPGWSSFAVHGDLVYTQEQRGDHEVVSCYSLATGEPVWTHRDAVRFYESNAGAGPRSTPAVDDGRVYTLGATGILNALDAASGAVVWSRNAQTDTGAPLPGWGFAGSPLAVGDLVIVATSGRLAGYDAATGKPRWTQKTDGGGYSSPHLAMIDGVPQILLLSGGGVSSVSPADGTRLWQQSGGEGASIVQPAFTPDGDVLVARSDMMGATGISRIAVSKPGSGQAPRPDSGQASEWTLDERWTTRGLKPYFNDFVVHKGHAFGFDGAILSCIDLANGERKWKGGRYGAGQMVLLPDQDVLLVLSEEGELALVSATADKFTELARFKAIEGKTWNHPAVVGDVLLVRNGEEMAAFRLPRAGR